MNVIDTSDLIGALELSDYPASFGDGVLEIAAEKVALGPTTGCPPTRTLIACVVDDAMLRTAGATMANPTPTTSLGCLPTVVVCKH